MCHCFFFFASNFVNLEVCVPAGESQTFWVLKHVNWSQFQVSGCVRQNGWVSSKHQVALLIPGQYIYIFYFVAVFFFYGTFWLPWQISELERKKTMRGMLKKHKQKSEIFNLNPLLLLCFTVVSKIIWSTSCFCFHPWFIITLLIFAGLSVSLPEI